MSKRLLITGATGFVGKFLIDHAVEAGMEITALIRKSSDISRISHHPIEYLYHNITSYQEILEVLKENRYDYILHNAGVTKAMTTEGYESVNYFSTRHFVDAITELNLDIKKFLFTSSLAAVGPADFTTTGIVNSETPPHPVTMYGRSKLKAEKYICGNANFPYLIIRPSIVYGPGDTELMSVYKSINIGLKAKIGGVPQKLTMVYVKDLARIMIESLKSPIENKTYIVTDTFEYDTSTFMETIARALGKKTFSLTIPISIVNAVAHISEAFSKITGEYPTLNTDKMNEIKARNWRCDVTPIVNELNYHPNYNLQKGMEETILWYKKEGWL